MPVANLPNPLVPKPLVQVEHVMGTVVSFDVRVDDERFRTPMQVAVETAVAWLHRVDEVFSTYRADSQISKLGNGELRLSECDGDVTEVLDLCAEVGRETNGYFSSMYAGRLDPSGVVKGWAIQRASELLGAAGSTRHCVNGGGDLQAVGEPTPGAGWQIGIAHPLYRESYASVVTVRDGAVATSGTAERGAHVIDPFTGKPVTALASVTVVGTDLIRTDAYATAALAMGGQARDWLERRPGFEGFAVVADGSGWWTSGYPKVGTVPQVGTVP
jgi:FAD:protein FMN transferase